MDTVSLAEQLYYITVIVIWMRNEFKLSTLIVTNYPPSADELELGGHVSSRQSMLVDRFTDSATIPFTYSALSPTVAGSGGGR